MRRFAPLVLSTSLVLAAGGCTKSIPKLLEQSQDRADESVDIVCEACPELFGSEEQCRELIGSPLFPDGECTAEALDEDADASRETLSCVLDIQDEYNACLEDKLECGDPDSYLSCQDIIENPLTGCPELPISVLTALQGCG